MKRTTIYLNEEIVKWLEKENKRTGLKQSEIIRKALDYYRVRRDKRKEGK